MRSLLLIPLFLMLAGFRAGDGTSLVQERLRHIENEVPLPYNKHVANYIEVYTERKARQTARILALSEYYFPLFESVMDEYGLPRELKYMAVIESALNPRAVSRVGATGLWQFMYSTAREYRLTINSYVDERGDERRSTDAAARYLKNMHDRYGDWLLVIASYNCGPGNVNKAIRRAGGSNDFWSIYRYLPRETRGYVPAFIAAMYALEYAGELGIEPNYEDTEFLAYLPVETRRELLLGDLAREFDLDADMLRMANASLIGQIIPPGYPLRLPESSHAQFHDMADTLYLLAAHKIETQQLRRKIRTSGAVQRVVPDDPNLASIIYTVKEGDNLGFIANWYDTGLDRLRAWNGLRGSRITVGQELIVYVPKDKLTSYERYDVLTNRQKNILSSDRDLRMLYARRTDDKFVYHEVKAGETFWIIKELYPGATVEGIRELNKVDDRDLKPGMYLKIMENV